MVTRLSTLCSATNGIQFSFNIIFPPLFTLILDFLKLVSIDIFGALELGCVGSWAIYGKFTVAPRGTVLVNALLFLFHRIHASKLPPGSATAHHQLDRTLKIGFTFMGIYN
eukprot:COSAG04_NODE_12749_length_637_cov_0.856877_1_plen_111_part_00